MMLRDDWECDNYHSANYEALEERLALSADPLTNLLHPALISDVGTTTLNTVPHEVKQFGSAFRQAPNVGQAWSDVQYVHSNYNLTGAGQTVAVIDSGIAYDHVALGGAYGTGQKVVGGWDFAENDSNPYDDAPAGFHGTHVAGVVGAEDKINPGVASGADLVALRVFDDNGNSSFNWVEQALQWVHQHRNDYANPITTVNLSLGFDWNANTVPQWANLEDDFAQLKADGIFISVSAGNGFATYNTVGLSYPAASPYVVPVASVNSNGVLSTFSQRNSRVLAAPGQGIMSTVPDSLYGADGVKNDWAAASGTSMAAPWVAGASVLVREAMQRVGMTNITEDTIYNELRSTSDIIHDSATNADYCRVNLRRAIETVLTSTNNNNSNNNASNQPATVARENWGTEDFKQIANQSISGEKWYTITAANRGFFTVESWFNNAAGDINLELYRSDGTLVVASNSTANSERVDTRAAQGETFQLRVTGTNSNVAFRFTNLVEEVGSGVVVHGFSGDDQFIFRANDPTSYFVGVNGVGYAFTKPNVTGFQYQGNGGNDSIQITGSNANETATFSATAVQLTSNAYTTSATGIESVQITAGTGSDIARMYDSAGDDTFTAYTRSATLSGTNYSFRADGFDRVEVYSSTGNDTATLYDSAGDDIFTGTKAASYMVGGGAFNVAIGFENVYAKSINGGNDLAGFYDSAGDDRFHIYGTNRRMEGDNYFVHTENFRNTTVNATQGGGNDTVIIYDLGNNDTITGRGNQLAISTANPVVTYGFEQAVAYAKTGQKPRSDVSAVDYLFSKNGF